MSDDPERLLDRLLPRGAPAELRARVLATVAAELRAKPKRRFRGRGWAVAAGVLLAVALNGWVSRRSEERLAALYGPEPAPADVADLGRSVESVSDADTARWAVQRLAPRPRDADPFRRERLLLQESTELLEATTNHVPVDASPEKAGAGRWRPADDRVAGQRGAGLGHGQPA
ncbi:MAG: hypothetical protein ACJ8F7_06225 [Gemmataceae bacterium]